MKSLPHLRAYWSNQLDGVQTRTPRASPHQRWALRMQAHVYRFMLNFYRDGGWNDLTDATDASVRSGRLHIAKPLDLGPPPKSTAQIRAKLKSVIGNASLAPGPHASGLRAHDWVAIGSFRIRHSEAIRGQLKRNGIPFTTASVGTREIIRVPYAVQEYAHDLANKVQPATGALRLTWSRLGVSSLLTFYLVALVILPSVAFIYLEPNLGLVYFIFNILAICVFLFWRVMRSHSRAQIKP